MYGLILIYDINKWIEGGGGHLKTGKINSVKTYFSHISDLMQVAMLGL